MYTDYSKVLILLSFLFISSIGFAQDDPILFTVGDAEVGLSEFDYIYSKTNGQEATYSDASLREYLDLYVNFKLKVRKPSVLRWTRSQNFSVNWILIDVNWRIAI